MVSFLLKSIFHGVVHLFTDSWIGIVLGIGVIIVLAVMFIDGK